MAVVATRADPTNPRRVVLGRFGTILLYESGPAVKLGTLFWFGSGASRTLG